jgi:hypothetical protein
MSFDEDVKKNGMGCAFIPHKLEIEGRSELEVFSLNVLFMGFAIKDGSQVSASALYEPDLASFKKEDNKCSMRYNNAYGGDSWLNIIYDEKDKSYHGDKFVDGKPAGSAYGAHWDGFFVHFTMLGVVNGEMCQFDKIDNL